MYYRFCWLVAKGYQYLAAINLAAYERHHNKGNLDKSLTAYRRYEHCLSASDDAFNDYLRNKAVAIGVKMDKAAANLDDRLEFTGRLTTAAASFRQEAYDEYDRQHAALRCKLAALGEETL